MSQLGQIIESVHDYDRFVEAEVSGVRKDPARANEVMGRWRDIIAKVGKARTPTGLELPTLALPRYDEPGEICRFILEGGLPGEFPYVSAAYSEQYLSREQEDGVGGDKKGEEPTRLFAGLGLAEDTNQRFHYLAGNQRSKRLSTAFDGPTLYGVGGLAPGVFGKIGEGGVAIDTVEDVERLYAGFDLDQPNVSVSMTISGPAPILLAMYIAAAKHRFGPDVVPKLRGTIQADVLKEVQAQNEALHL